MAPMTVSGDSGMCVFIGVGFAVVGIVVRVVVGTVVGIVVTGGLLIEI
jgi:hypothetical protein